MPDEDARLILAFKEPPLEYEFKRSKSGRCWWRKTPTLELAQTIAADLAALDIHGSIKRITPQKLPYFPRRNGTLGATARQKRSARNFYS